MMSIWMWGLLRVILLFSDPGCACPPDVNHLTLNPSVIIKEYDEPISVNCTYINSYHDGIYWKVGNVTMDEEYKSYAFLSLPKLDWNAEARCTIILKENDECSKDLEITLYRRPDLVIVFPLSSEHPIEGRLYELQCDIINVAPIQNLTVKWYRNNQTMSTHLFNNTTKTPLSESSLLTLNITREDDGAVFTCEALLDLGPEGPQPPVMSKANYTLSVHYPPQFKEKRHDVIMVNENGNASLNCEALGNPPPQYTWKRYEKPLSDDTKYLNLSQVNETASYTCTATNYLRSIVQHFYVILIKSVTTPAPSMMTNPQESVPKDCPLTITPAEIVVRYGDPVSINCSTTSTDVIGIGWEGKGTENATVVTWTVAKLENWNMSPVCLVTLKDTSQCEKFSKITLYKTPDIVSVSAVDISGPLFPGADFELKCDILNVAPVNSLRVNWYKNNRVVHTEHLYNSSVTSKNVFPILKTTLGIDERVAKFTCEAELNLGVNGPQPDLSKISEPYIAVVECPVTITPAEIVVRYGDPASANCSALVSDALGMGWEATSGGVGFTNASTVHWTVEKLEDWDIQSSCFIMLKNNYPCVKKLNITIYKTPDKVSVLGDGPMVEGEKHHLKCDISAVILADKLKVKWYRNNEYVQDMFDDTNVDPNNNNNTILRIIPNKDDNGANFTCVAELHLGENGPQPVPAETSEPYTAVVHYEPLFSSCPRDYNGQEHMFSMNMVPCKADANPTPVVHWYYHGTLINASELLTRSHSGEYRAEATNQLGKSSKSVYVTIEYGPSFSCNGHYEVEENGNFHSKCQPEGMPKPNTVWLKDGVQMASPQLLKRQDSGKYLILATNKHGNNNHTLYLDVLYAPEFKEGNYSKEMMSGENVTLNCYAEGNPSPQIQWRYPPAANVLNATRGQQRGISVIEATSTNAGVYICGATNKVGSVTRTVTLVIKGQTQAISLNLIYLVLSLLILLLVVIIMAFFCSRKKKHGQYNFVSGSDDLPLSTRSNGI